MDLERKEGRPGSRPSPVKAGAWNAPNLSPLQPEIRTSLRENQQLGDEIRLPCAGVCQLSGRMEGIDMAKGGHNEAKFKGAILALSNSADWDEAKAEWELHFVYEDPSDRSCECEHSPIHQICVIKNRKNGRSTEVGNVCVKRFLRLMSNRLFAVIRRLQWDVNKSLNPAALKLFRERNVISLIEERDYLLYWRRRKHMRDDQKRQKLLINQRVLAYVAKETAALIARAQAQGLDV
ncbi:MAG TPA: hypothetical protein VGB62_01640 [Allosphingosinicella sp.]